MYERQANRVKTSLDLNESVATRLAEIKEMYHLSFIAVVNEIMDKTICLSWETQERLLNVINKEVSSLAEECKQCSRKDVFWKDSLTRQLKELEELTQLLKL